MKEKLARNYRPKHWYSMVESPYMHDGVKMAKENPERALELELQHQAFRIGQEAGADAMAEALKEEIKKVENPYATRQVDGATTTFTQERGAFEFEQCRQAILNLLRPKENVAGSVEL